MNAAFFCIRWWAINSKDLRGNPTGRRCNMKFSERHQSQTELEGWRPDQALASPHGLHTKWIQYWHHIPVQVLDFYISLSPPSSNIILTLTCSGSRFRQESMHLTQMSHKLTYELWGDVFVISWKCTLIQANSEAREARTLISQRIHLFMPSLP